MTPNEAASSNERLVDALHDCIFCTKDQMFQCPCCREEYTETMHYWQNPHSSAREVWVCSEGCAHEWIDKNWDYTPEIEKESRNRLPPCEGDFLKILTSEIRNTML